MPEGVANWRLDEALSTRDCAIFANTHTQRVVAAFRGSLTLSDWVSNLRHIVPGDEASSRAFRECVETARAAQLK